MNRPLRHLDPNYEPEQPQSDQGYAEQTQRPPQPQPRQQEQRSGGLRHLDPNYVPPQQDMQQAQTEQPADSMDLFSVEQRWELVRQFAPELVERDPELAASLAMVEGINPEQFELGMQQMQTGMWLKDFQEEWDNKSIGEQMDYWEDLGEDEQDNLQQFGFSPPSENWLFRQADRVWRVITGVDEAAGNVIGPIFGAGEGSLLLTPFRMMEAATEHKRKFFLGGIKELEDEIFREPDHFYEDGRPLEPHHRYEDEHAFHYGLEGGPTAQAIHQGVGGVTSMMLSGARVTWEMLKNPGRWGEFYRVGSEEGGVFFDSYTESVASEFNLSGFATEMVKDIARNIDISQLRPHIEGQEQNWMTRNTLGPTTDPGTLYREALQNYIMEEVPGETQDAQARRSIMFAFFADNEEFKHASLKMADGRITFGSVDAIRKGLRPGSEKFRINSGLADAYELIYTDPVIALGNARRVGKAFSYAVRGDEVASSRRVLELAEKGSIIPGMRHPFRRVLDDVGQSVSETLNARLADNVADVAEDQLPDVLRRVRDQKGTGNMGQDRMARRQPLWNKVYDDVVEHFMSGLHRTKVGDTFYGAVVRENEHGIRFLDGNISHTGVARWMASEEGLRAVKRGQFGGHLWGMPVIPTDSTFHLMFKGPKRAAARAIDWMADTPYRHTKKLMDQGILTEADAGKLRLNLNANPVVAQRLFSHTREQAGTGRAILETSNRLGRMPMTGIGNFFKHFVNQSVRGPISLSKPGFSTTIRQYTSILPAEMRARYANLAAGTRNPAERIELIRSINHDLMDIAGLKHSTEGQKYVEHVLKEFDEAAYGVGGREMYASQTATSTIPDGRGGRVHSAIGHNDLATQVAMPDMRRLHALSKRATAMENIMDPLSKATQSGKADYMMGRIWQPTVLFRLSFPVRTSADEFGLAMLREGGAGLLQSRYVAGAVQRKNIVPRFMRGDRLAARMMVRSLAAGDIARAMGWDATEAARINRWKRGEHRLRDDEAKLLKGKQFEENPEALWQRELTRQVRLANPYEIIGNHLALRANRWGKWVDDMITRGQKTSIRLREFQEQFGYAIDSTRDLIQSQKRMLIFDPMASRHVPRHRDFMASAQGAGAYNIMDFVGPKQLPFRGGGVAPHPTDRRLNLIRESYKKTNQNDPTFLEDLATVYTSRAHDPYYRAVNAAHQEVAERFASGEMSVDEWRRHMRERVKQNLEADDAWMQDKDAFYRNQMTADGRHAVPDAEFDWLENAPASRNANKLNEERTSARTRPPGDDGPADPSDPGGGGGPDTPRPGGGGGKDKDGIVEVGSDADVALYEARHAVSDEIDRQIDQAVSERFPQHLEDEGFTFEQFMAGEIPEERIAAIRNKIISEDDSLEELFLRQAMIAEGTPGEITETIIDSYRQKYGNNWSDWYERSIVEHPNMREIYWAHAYEDMRVTLETLIPPEMVDDLFYRLGLLDKTTGRYSLESLFQNGRTRRYSLPDGDEATLDVAIIRWVEDLRATRADGTEATGPEAMNLLQQQRREDRIRQFSSQFGPEVVPPKFKELADGTSSRPIAKAVFDLFTDGDDRLQALRSSGSLVPENADQLQNWLKVARTYHDRAIPDYGFNPAAFRGMSPDEVTEEIKRITDHVLEPKSLERLTELTKHHQAMTPHAVVNTYERFWQMWMSEAPLNWRGVIDNIDDLPPLMQLIAKLNEAITGTASLGFVNTPLHARFIQQRVSNLDRPTINSILRGNPQIFEYRQILAQKEGAWGHFATGTNRQGAIDGVIETVEDLNNSVMRGEMNLGFHDAGESGAEMMRRGAHLRPEFADQWADNVWADFARQHPRKAEVMEEVWADLLEDAQYMAWRRADNPPDPSKLAEWELAQLNMPRMTVDEFAVRHIDDPEARGFARGFLEDVVGPDGDLARIDEVKAAMMVQRLRPTVGDDVADRMLDDLIDVQERRRIAESWGADPDLQVLPDDLITLRQHMRDWNDGAMDEALPWQPTPLHVDEVMRYLNFQQTRIRRHSQMPDEVFDDVGDFANMVYGRELRSISEQEIEELGPEMFRLSDEDIAAGRREVPRDPDEVSFGAPMPGGVGGDAGGTGRPPGTSGGATGDYDGWEGAVDSAHTVRDRGVARQSEAEADHVDALISSWAAEAFADPFKLARRFEAGDLPTRREGHVRLHRIVDEDSGEVRYERLDTAEQHRSLSYDDEIIEMPADAVRGRGQAEIPDEVIARARASDADVTVHFDEVEHSIARVNPRTGDVVLDHAKMEADYDAGLLYLRGEGGTPGSQQKGVVFERQGIDIDELRAWMDQNGGVDMYEELIVAHEAAHRKLGHQGIDHTDWQSDFALRQEMEANIVAFDELGISGMMRTPRGTLDDSTVDLVAGTSGAPRYRKPLTGEDLEATEDLLDRVMMNIRGLFEEQGRDTTYLPTNHGDFFEVVNRNRADNMPMDFVQEIRDEVVKIAGSNRRLVQAFDRLVQGGGRDGHMVRRTIGDDLLAEWDRRALNGESVAVNPEELSQIDHSHLPGSTYGIRTKTEKRNIWSEIVNHGMGEVLMPVLDTISRDPMLLFYYNRAWRDVESVVFNARIEGRIYNMIENTRGITGSKFKAHSAYDSAHEILEDIHNIRRQLEDMSQEEMAAVVARPLKPKYRGSKEDMEAARQFRMGEWESALAETEHGQWMIEELFPVIAGSIGKKHANETVGEALTRGLRRTRNAEQDLHEQAMTSAFDMMSRFTDNEGVSSIFAMKTRNLFPFWWAEERFLKRLSQSFYASPDQFRKAQLIYKGIQSTGMIEQDDFGNDIFVYPFGESINAGINFAIEKAFGKTALHLPEVHRVTGQLQWSMPGLTTHGRPLPGPLGSVPVRILKSYFPQTELYADAFLGEFASDERRGLAEQFYPPTAVRIMEAMNQEKAMENNFSQLFGVLNYMHANDMIPDENASALELQEFQDRLENWAQVLSIEKAIYGFVGIAPPQIDIPEGATHPAFREIVAELGWELGIDEFMRRHPDEDLNTMFGTRTAGGAPIPATEEVFHHLNEHEEFFSTYPDAGAYLLPIQEFTSDFDNRAWQKQMALEMRQRRGHDKADWLNQLMRDFYFQNAADTYFESRENYEEMREPLKGEPEAVELDSAWSIWVNEYKTRYPIFAQELESRERAERRDNVLRNLRDAFEDERLPENERTEVVKTMVEGFDNYRRMRQDIGAGQDNATRAQRDVIRSAFVNWGQEQVDEYPDELRHLWNTIMLPEINLNRDDAIEILGRQPLEPIGQLPSPGGEQ